jgi:hypothetical protein
VEREVY